MVVLRLESPVYPGQTPGVYFSTRVGAALNLNEKPGLSGIVYILGATWDSIIYSDGARHPSIPVLLLLCLEPSIGCTTHPPGVDDAMQQHTTKANKPFKPKKKSTALLDDSGYDSHRPLALGTAPSPPSSSSLSFNPPIENSLAVARSPPVHQVLLQAVLLFIYLLIFIVRVVFTLDRSFYHTHIYT